MFPQYNNNKKNPKKKLVVLAHTFKIKRQLLSAFLILKNSHYNTVTHGSAQLREQ
jgi:hypothetical protein